MSTATRFVTYDTTHADPNGAPKYLGYTQLNGMRTDSVNVTYVPPRLVQLTTFPETSFANQHES